MLRKDSNNAYTHTRIDSAPYILTRVVRESIMAVAIAPAFDRNIDTNCHDPVSYTHLDVYKRQVY